ncbi:uncharacterized protein BX663DRAFT_480509 [Cokeromyces recurvatus]|uniref:uncharacterized protein n=1 Tax=Cokeromyces recurvatus TaxID=90255 RepID=UPI00222124D9|nr:uncharacterized protein BX663DRAFT_480509 [Cokeromyces recurvatus]KAI7898114.1 hypothetical protein BX663DRAFT_480509 [Cokeromyces recurvatus]
MSISSTKLSSIKLFGLPYLQWKENVHNKSQPIYNNIDTCLNKFEEALHAYDLDFDMEWLHLLPLCLSYKQNIWLNKLVKLKGLSITWEIFKEAFKEHYQPTASKKKGNHVDRKRSPAKRELFDIIKRDTEPMDKFIDRFRLIAINSKIRDQDILITCFKSALPADKQKKLNKAVTVGNLNQQHSIAFLCETANLLDRYERKIFPTYDPERNFLTNTFFFDLSIPTVKKKHKLIEETLFIDDEQQQPPNKKIKNSKRNANEPSGVYYCSLHHVDTHNTEDCRAMKSFTIL